MGAVRCFHSDSRSLRQWGGRAALASNSTEYKGKVGSWVRSSYQNQISTSVTVSCFRKEQVVDLLTEKSVSPM
jgi:hypothetical protein